MPDPRSEYQRRIARWSGQIARGERWHLRLANLRLAVFGAGALIAWLAFSRNALSPGWLLPVLVAFLTLVVVHAKTLNALDRAVRARRVYERGIDRIDGRWAGSGPDGDRFREGHPYAHDLDLFGPGSLFQLLSAARTEAGEDTLAAWLGAPATIDEIGLRQQAVAELQPRIDFREDLAVIAAEAHVGRTSALSAWADATPAGLSMKAGVVLAVCAAATAVAVVGALLGRVSTGWAVGWVLAQIAIASIWRRQVALVTGRIDPAAHELELVRELIARVEREPFESPRIAAIRSALAAEGMRPSQRIGQLQRRIAVLDTAHNPYFQLTLVAPLLLIRSQAAVAIDRWQAAHGRALGRWLVAIGELEAFSSMAAYAYEHPADPAPRVVNRGPMLEARGLAHPLIVETSAVPNDVELGGSAPHVLLVSGSNMSGKSTLLRAVGLNVVLAQAGAPVRAASLTLSPLAIGATLRIEDSLQEGRSRFYAEILRIRAIVETARGPMPLLFLLDEILHGTNSYDRRIGAQAIVSALVEAGAIGLVTTHDLALTSLVETQGARAANVHFEDRIEEGTMRFDYRMRPGVVERSNALALMRAVGLDV